MNINILLAILEKIKPKKIYVVECHMLRIHKYFYEKEEAYNSMKEFSIIFLMDHIKKFKMVNFMNDFKEFGKVKEIDHFLINLQKELPNMSLEYIEQRIKYMYDNYLTEDIKKLEMVRIKGAYIYLRKQPIK